MMLSFFFMELKGQNNKEIILESLVLNQEGNPVAGASVSGVEGNVVQYADLTGKFTDNAPVNSKLSVDAHGYKSQVVNADSTIEKIILENDSMGQMVNVAYKTIERSDLPGAISVLNPDNYIDIDYSFSVQDGIYGRVGGLLGVNNIWNLGSALVMIDGIQRNFSDIRLEEVDQITFLKGVNAVALYGSRAANGVILITTKRGEANTQKINIRATTGIATPKLFPKFLNSAEYMTLYNEASINDGGSEVFDEETINNFASGNQYRYPDVDYYSSDYLKNYINQTDVVTEFSGGNEDARFYSNIGWANQSTLLNVGEGKNEKDNRFNIRGNVDLDLNNFISSTVDVFARLENSRRGLADYYADAATFLPYKYTPLLPMNLINPDSTNVVQLAELSKNIIDGQYILGGTQEYLTNPFADLYAGGYQQYINRVLQLTNTINIDLDRVVKGLSFHTTFNADYYNAYIQSINNDYSVYAPIWDTVPNSAVIEGLTKYGTDLRPGDLNVTASGQTRNLGFSLQFNYMRTLNDVHNISAILLASGTSITTNGVWQPTTNTNLGLQLGYNYEHRYYVDFSSAILHSTKLPEGNRVGFSPTLGLGWLLSAEDFLAGSDVIDHLKLTASAGIVNTDLVINDFYLYDNVYTRQGFFAWNDGIYSNSATTSLYGGNPELSFAKRKELNIGLEGSLFNRLLWIESTFFLTQLDDLPTQRFTQYPSYFRTFVPYTNYNGNQFTGFDVMVNLNKNVGEVELNLGVIVTYVDSKVKQRDELYADSYQNRVGKPVDAIFGLVSDGFFIDDADIANHPEQAFGDVQPGDIKYIDQNGDNIINERDEVMIGRWSSPFNYALNFSISFKNLTLFVQGVGAMGADGVKTGDYYWVDGDDKYSEVVLDRWSEATSSTATYPRLSAQQNNNNFRYSDFWLYKTDRFYLNKVQITYDFPATILGKSFVKGLGVYVMGSNLLTFAENSELLDLNVGSNPQFRYFTVGIRGKF